MLSVGTNYAFRPFGAMKPKLQEQELPLRKYSAKLIDAMGTVWYALVEAHHFPEAYAKGKKVAKEMDAKLGVIVAV